MPSKSKEAPHLRVRIESGLLARLEKAREKSGRTLTGEIVWRLEQSFKREDQQLLMEQTVTATIDRLRIEGFGPTSIQKDKTP